LRRTTEGLWAEMASRRYRLSAVCQLTARCHPKCSRIGGEGQNRTVDTTIFSPRKRVNRGRLKTAAPRLSAIFHDPSPLQTTLSRYRLSLVCHPSSSSRKVLALLQSRFPVSRPTTRVRHGHDQDATSFDSINDAEREALKQVPAGSMVERRPCFRKAHDGRFGSIDFAAECCSGGYAALGVPARSRLCLLESFFEVFKLAGHGRLRRGCDDAPPTIESSWRCLRRLDRAVRESRPTTLLRRRRLLRLRGFESARQQGRLALRQRVEELRPGAA
jgi:hypothetical protein